MTETIEVGADPYSIVITPDGRYAYVSNSSSASVSVIAIDPPAGPEPDPEPGDDDPAASLSSVSSMNLLKTLLSTP